MFLYSLPSSLLWISALIPSDWTMLSVPSLSTAPIRSSLEPRTAIIFSSRLKPVEVRELRDQLEDLTVAPLSHSMDSVFCLQQRGRHPVHLNKDIRAL